MNDSQKPIVSDELKAEYTKLHPEGKQIPPNMLRNEAWVAGKIEGFKAGTPSATPSPDTPPSENPGDSAPTPGDGPAPTPAPAVEEEKVEEGVTQTAGQVSPHTAVPTVQLPSATVKGDKPEFVEQVMTSQMIATKKALDKAPKIMFMVPKADWEKVGAYETVTINGYRMVIKKGAMVELPMPVFQILANKYNIENTAGLANRLDVNPDKDPSLAS